MIDVLDLFNNGSALRRIGVETAPREEAPMFVTGAVGDELSGSITVAGLDDGVLIHVSPTSSGGATRTARLTVAQVEELHTLLEQATTRARQYRRETGR